MTTRGTVRFVRIISVRITREGGATNMWTLQEEFSHFEIGPSSQFRNLTLFPLVRRNTPTRRLDYLLLEDGIAQGKVRVTELHGDPILQKQVVQEIGRAHV